jgi:hypothetical protein
MTMTQTDINVPVDGTVTSAKLSGDLVTPGALDVTGTVTADGLTVDGAATIDGGATDNTVLTLDSGTANTYLKITDSNSTNGTFIGATTNDLNFYPNNTLAVTMAASGNVGINNSSPSSYFSNASNLVVGGATGANGITISGSTDTQIFFADGTSGADAYRGIIRYSHADNSLSFWTDATEATRIDSSGRVTMPYQPAFSVRPSSDQSNIARPANTTVLWGTEIFDQGGNFSSNTFTAPVTGRYQLNVNIYAHSVDSAADYVQFALVTSNRTYYYIFSTNTLSQDAAYMSFPIAVLADMDASDTAIVQANLNNTGSAQMDITTISYFSGYLVA